MNRNNVPRKPRYFAGWLQAHFFDLFLDRGDHDFEEALPARDMHFGHELARDQPCANGHHEHQHPSRDDRAIELEKAVPPENQFIGSKAQCWSPSSRLSLLFGRRSCDPPHDNDARDQKSQEARHEPRPMTLRNKIESSQNDTGSQQQAAEEPERRPFGRNTLLDRPPKAGEEKHTEQGTGKERQGKSRDVIHPNPPAFPYIPSRPNARH